MARGADLTPMAKDWRYGALPPAGESGVNTHLQAIVSALHQAFPTAEWGGACLILPGKERPVAQAFWGTVPQVPAVEAPPSRWADWLLQFIATEHLRPIFLQGQLRGGILVSGMNPRPEWAPAVLGALASSLQTTASCLEASSVAICQQAELAADLASDAVHGWNNMLQGVAMHAERLTRRSPPEARPGLDAIGRLCEKGRQVGKSLLSLGLNRPGAVTPLDEMAWRLRAALPSLKGGRNVRMEVEPLPRHSVQGWIVQTSVLLLVNAVANRWGPVWLVHISGSAHSESMVMLRVELMPEGPPAAENAQTQRIRRAAIAAGQILEQVGGGLHWHEASDRRFVCSLFAPHIDVRREGEPHETAPLDRGE